MNLDIREAIARAIYECPKDDGTTDDWNALSEERRQPWLGDADRVLAVVKESMTTDSAESRRMRLVVDNEPADTLPCEVQPSEDA